MAEGNHTHDAFDARGDGDNPEQLLAGADRPRPLPPDLRARLEEALEGAGAGTTARALPGEVRDKLEVTLRAEEPEKKWRHWAPRLSVAAAVLIALAIFVPTLARGPGRGPGALHVAAGTAATAATPATAGATGAAAATGAAGAPDTASTAGKGGIAPGAEASRSGLSNLRAVPPNPAVLTPMKGSAKGSAKGVTNSPANSEPSTSAATHVPAAAPSQGFSGATSGSRGVPPAAFVAPPPVVSGISPKTGPVGGGNWVIVRGSDLAGASGAYFGQVPARRVNVVSPTELKALAPAHSAGTVDVVVSGPSGRSQLSPADRYSFTP